MDSGLPRIGATEKPEDRHFASSPSLQLASRRLTSLSTILLAPDYPKYPDLPQCPFAAIICSEFSNRQILPETQDRTNRIR